MTPEKPKEKIVTLSEQE